MQLHSSSQLLELHVLDIRFSIKISSRPDQMGHKHGISHIKRVLGKRDNLSKSFKSEWWMCFETHGLALHAI
jgi:hypothetical protein